MTQNPGKPVSSADLRALDIYEFANSGRQAAGALRVSQMPRMLAEVPADAPERDSVFTWQAEGLTQPELQDDGVEAPQPYLRLAVHGSIWLMCQRCPAILAASRCRCNVSDRGDGGRSGRVPARRR